MKLSFKFLIFALYILMIGGPAQALTLADQTCIDPSGRIQIFIQKVESQPKIKKIEFYEDNQLRASDSGPFSISHCHVQGAVYTGEIFTYGGCSPWEDQEAQFLTWDKLFRLNSDINREEVTADLKQFKCFLMVAH